MGQAVIGAPPEGVHDMRNGIFASRPGRAASSIFALLAVAALVPRRATAEKYFCGGRELTAAETAEVTRVIEVLRKALSAAPAGWSIQSDDAGVDCLGFSKPGPAPIFYMRSYLHIAPSGQPSAQEQQAHVEEGEQRLTAHRAQAQQAASGVVAARTARDQKAAQDA